MQSSNDNFCLHLLTVIKDSFGSFSMSDKPCVSKYSDHLYFMDNFKKCTLFKNIQNSWTKSILCIFSLSFPYLTPRLPLTFWNKTINAFLKYDLSFDFIIYLKSKEIIDFLVSEKQNINNRASTLSLKKKKLAWYWFLKYFFNYSAFSTECT